MQFLLIRTNFYQTGT